jgi:hypothetical protein
MAQAPCAIRRSLVAAAPRHRRRHGRPVVPGPHRLNLPLAIKGREPDDNSPFASSAAKNRVLTSLMTRSAAADSIRLENPHDLTLLLPYFS